jgi:hypothetical protein
MPCHFWLGPQAAGTDSSQRATVHTLKFSSLFSERIHSTLCIKLMELLMVCREVLTGQVPYGSMTPLQAAIGVVQR